MEKVSGVDSLDSNENVTFQVRNLTSAASAWRGSPSAATWRRTWRPMKRKREKKQQEEPRQKRPQPWFDTMDWRPSQTKNWLHRAGLKGPSRLSKSWWQFVALCLQKNPIFPVNIHTNWEVPFAQPCICSCFSFILIYAICNLLNTPNAKYIFNPSW